VYEIRLPAGDIRAAIETSDCRAGSPWRVLSLSPEKTEALISANRSLALLDLGRDLSERLGGSFRVGHFRQMASGSRRCSSEIQKRHRRPF